MRKGCGVDCLNKIFRSMMEKTVHNAQALLLEWHTDIAIVVAVGPLAIF